MEIIHWGNSTEIKGPKTRQQWHFVYLIKNKLTKIFLLFKAPIYHCFRHVNMHYLLQQRHQVNALSVTVHSSAFDSQHWKVADDTRTRCCVQIQFVQPLPSVKASSGSSSLSALRQPLPSVVVPMVSPAPHPQPPLTSSEWRERWWEHPPRKPRRSAMSVYQSRIVCPPSHLAPWSS